MARLLLRFLCCALCLRASCGEGPLVDGTALVQSAAIRAHSNHQTTVQSALGGLATTINTVMTFLGQQIDTAVEGAHRGIPGAVPISSITLHRGESSGDAGAHMEFHMSTGCEECQLTWGDNVNFYTKAYLPTGLQRGDKFNIKLDMAFDVGNLESPYSVIFMGDSINVDGTCEMCGGSCKLAAVKDKDSFDLKFPTVLHSNETCTEDRAVLPGLRELLLLDHPVRIPKVNASFLELSGSINITMAMLRQDGSRKAAASASLLFAPQGYQSTELSQLRLSPKAHATVSQGQGLPRLLESTVGSFLMGMGAVAESAAPAETAQLNLVGSGEALERDVGSVIVTDLTVRKLEGGTSQNLSFAGSSPCRPRGRLGSVGCYIPFGKPSTFSSAVHLAANFDEGSHILVSMKPKLSGILSSMVSRVFLKRFELTQMEVPLCGEPSIIVWQDRPTLYNPLPCGDYALNLNLLEKKLRVPDSHQLKLPKLVTGGLFNIPLDVPALDIGKLPSMSFEMRLELFHNDGSPIADVQFRVGLDKAV